MLVEKKMDIKKCWLLLSAKDMSFCLDANTSDQFISIDLFTQIMRKILGYSWECTIIGDISKLGKEYLKVISDCGVKAEMAYNNCVNKKNITTLKSLTSGSVNGIKTFDHGIFAIHRSELPEYDSIVKSILSYYRKLTITHAELLSYTDNDFNIYKEKLIKVGTWISENDALGSIDCLQISSEMEQSECGAGISKIAINSDGTIYICPLFARDNFMPCGNILEKIEIPNSHLLTRKYSKPCEECNVLHCSRCVYMNFVATAEVCVPSHNYCRLRHVELEAQAILASKSTKKLINREDCRLKCPDVYDPYEIVKVKNSTDDGTTEPWRKLIRSSAMAEELSSAQMLDIFHDIYGFVLALKECEKAGQIPEKDILENNLLYLLRRKNIEKYSDIEFEKGGLTINYIKSLLRTYFQKKLLTH
jgi:CXXX repeat peptide maturase